MKRSGIGGGLLVAGVMLASACATEGDGDGDGDNGDPIAEVALANGSTVSFYEPIPGGIGIAENAPPGVAPVVADGMSAVEVFRSIAPGEPVPEQLLAAQARVDAARAGQPSSAPAPTPAEASAAPGGTQSISDSDFIANWCSGNWQVIKFLPLHRNYNSSYYDDDVDEVKFSACANVGNIRMRVYINGDLEGGPWDIADGWCLGYHWTSGFDNDTALGQVYNVASTDRYDFCMRLNH